jgi:IstB-like ATP binding protein
VRDGAAVLELAVGDGVRVGVAGGAAPRRAGGAVSFGRVPRFHQTDHSTAATHQIARDAAVFGDEMIAAAVLDRLLHHSHVLVVQGESYRLKQKKRAGLVARSVG